MCNLVSQGFKTGSCLTKTCEKELPACESTLRIEEGKIFRLIKSAHLSRPEHYFSLYQSGCNFSCLKCHSWEFSQIASGDWMSCDDILELAKGYEILVTFEERKERVTSFHAQDLCHSCGSCISGERSKNCPGLLKPEQIILSPQGFGPARNIFAFTGGDLTCCPEFYTECTQLIKKHTNLFILIETNGYGLTHENLDILKKAGVDSFWLDVKAYDGKIHKKLTGCSNEGILKLPREIHERGFVLEILSLYIPEWVEKNQIKKIAELTLSVSEDIPFTILAYFPCYKMKVRPPSLSEMIETYRIVKDVGLKNVRLGNLGVCTGRNE